MKRIKKENKVFKLIADIVAQVETYREYPNPDDWFHALEYDQVSGEVNQKIAHKRFMRNYRKGKFFARYIKGRLLDVLSSFVYGNNHSIKGFIQTIKDNR